MSAWIDQGDSQLNEQFLEENIKEARKHDWTEISADELDSEVLCMICWGVIDPDNPTELQAYESEAGYVCRRCYDRYLRDFERKKA